MRNTLRWTALAAAALAALACEMGPSQNTGGGGQTTAYCAVTFETSDGEVDPASRLVTLGATITLPALADLETAPAGLILAVWADDIGDTWDPEEQYTVTGDVTFTAQWSAVAIKKYLVTYAPGEGAGTPPAAAEYAKNRRITLPGQAGMTAPERGKVFAGWDLKGVLYAAGDPYLVTRKAAFTALWALGRVTVTFERGDGAGGQPPESMELDYGTTIILPGQGGMTAPEQAKKFAGWVDNGTPYQAGDAYTVTRDTTLEAWWTGDGGAGGAGAFTITFDVNGGDPIDPETRTVLNGEVYGALPTPAWAGRVFAGWFTEAAGGTRITAETTVALAGPRTLYAHWYTAPVEPEEPDDFVVTLNLNYPGTAVTIMTVTNGGVYGDGTPDGALPSPARTGYAFLGWFTEREGGSEVTAATTVDLTADQTLWARWTLGAHVIDLARPEGGAGFTFNWQSSTFIVEADADDWVVTSGDPAAAVGRTLAFPAGFAGTVRLDGVAIGGGAAAGTRHGIDLGAGAAVTLVIAGNNAASAPGNGAGIRVGAGAALRIVGDPAGGTLTAEGRGGGAGIGGFRGEAAGSIEISGAALRVSAVGSVAAAGIGGGEAARAGAVVIQDGVTVTAWGHGEAAGIGGGAGGDAAGITITGGAAVVAVGGAYGGPGIGGPGAAVTPVAFGDCVVVSLRHEDAAAVDAAALGGSNDTVTGLDWGGAGGAGAGAGAGALVFAETDGSAAVSGAFMVERARVGLLLVAGTPAAGLTALYHRPVSGEPALNAVPADWAGKLERLNDLGWVVAAAESGLAYWSTDGAVLYAVDLDRLFPNRILAVSVTLRDAAAAVAGGGLGIDHGANMPVFKGWTTKPEYKGGHWEAGETLTGLQAVYAVWSTAAPEQSAWVAEGAADETLRKAFVITPADRAARGLRATIESNRRGHYVLLTDYTGVYYAVTAPAFTPPWSDDFYSDAGGDSASVFYGVFDGNGHGVELRQVDRTGAYSAMGLFGMAGAGAIIRNLRLTGTITVIDESAAAAGELNIGAAVGVVIGGGVVEDVVSEVTIDARRFTARPLRAAGVVGYAEDFTAIRCVYTGGITGVGADGSAYAGMVAWPNRFGGVSRCVVLSSAITGGGVYHRIAGFTDRSPALSGNYAIAGLPAGDEPGLATADGADVTAADTANPAWWAAALGSGWEGAWEAGAGGLPSLARSTANSAVWVPVLRR